MYGTCEIGTATNINLKNKNKSDSVGKATKNYKIKIIQITKFVIQIKLGKLFVILRIALKNIIIIVEKKIKYF